MPLLVTQLLWFARAELLQQSLGLHFADLNLLRRAFVHPQHGDRPEDVVKGAARELVRPVTHPPFRRI